MKFLRRVLPSVLLVLLLGAGVGFWFKHNQVLDWVAAKNYEPTAEIAGMTAQTTMTPYAKQLFYANRPVVEGKEAFNRHCTDPSEQVAVLGCFIGNRLGIYIYDVSDRRLNGIKPVTAAHEMLHQAYQRLNKKEKTRINGMLQEYHDLKATKKLKEKIASYKQSEPANLQNEMHSIFGTEASDLSDELEQYYKQYFTDRDKVLALHRKYQAEFDQRIARIKAYDKQLSRLKGQIEVNKQELRQREASLRQRRSQMDADLAANRVDEYNAAVPGFNASVEEYRILINQTNSLVGRHNQLLAERNKLAVQERELEDAINSNIQPE